MNILYGTLPALTVKNMARIGCPIFGVEVEMRGCVKLRELWMRGQGPVDKRRGCQACLTSSMCPVDHMIRMMETRNEHFSTDPDTIPIPRKVLDRIARLLPMPRVFERYGVPDGERARIEAWTQRDRGKLSSQPVQAKRDVKRNVAATEPTPVDNALIGAAVSGDLSAAINSAMEKAA